MRIKDLKHNKNKTNMQKYQIYNLEIYPGL